MRHPNVFLRLSLATMNCWASCLLFSLSSLCFVDMTHSNAALRVISKTVQSEGFTSPLPLLTSTNAKQIELNRGGRSPSSLGKTQRNTTLILCEHVQGFNKIPILKFRPDTFLCLKKRECPGKRKSQFFNMMSVIRSPYVQRNHLIPTCSTVIK